jgi:hypothetical protein
MASAVSSVGPGLTQRGEAAAIAATLPASNSADEHPSLIPRTRSLRTWDDQRSQHGHGDRTGDRTQHQNRRSLVHTRRIERTRFRQSSRSGDRYTAPATGIEDDRSG